MFEIRLVSYDKFYIFEDISFYKTYQNTWNLHSGALRETYDCSRSCLQKELKRSVREKN